MSFSASYFDNKNTPVVALHSSASNSAQWKKLSIDLEGRFEVHAYDLPGYGKAPLRADYSQTGTAKIAVPVIRKIEKFDQAVHLVGHSNGAGIAIKVAMMRPDLVKSLSLYEPATFHFLENEDARSRALYSEIRQLSGLISASAASDAAEAGMQRFLDFWNGAGFWSGLPLETRRSFTQMINAVMADFTNGFAESWTLADLHHLEIPTLLMMGLESPMLTQRVSTMIAKALPDARLALLPELAHMAPVTHPQWINPRILEHVAGVERPVVNSSWPTRQAA